MICSCTVFFVILNIELKHNTNKVLSWRSAFYSYYESNVIISDLDNVTNKLDSVQKYTNKRYNN